MNWFRLIRDEIPMEEILALRASQYAQPLYVESTITAGGTAEPTIPLSELGAFLVLSFTGFYTSLRIKALGVSLEDLGVCPLRMKISAGASRLQMFGDYVPMNLLLTPGRVRVDPLDPVLVTGGYALAAADIGPVPSPLYNNYGFVFPFGANDVITVSVKNDFAAAANGWTQRFGVCFLGIRATDIGKALRETKNSSAKR
jgi:hypothetical protein